MPIKYKIDMLAALKDAGYNTTRLRREKLLSESTIQALRIGKMVSHVFAPCYSASLGIFWNMSKRPGNNPGFLP